MKMNKTISKSLITEAEHWCRLFESTTGTASERADFKKWYHTNSDHQLAYAQVYVGQDSNYDFDVAAHNFTKGSVSAPELAMEPEPTAQQKLAVENEYIRVAASGLAVDSSHEMSWLDKIKQNNWQYAAAACLVLMVVSSLMTVSQPNFTDYQTGIGKTERIELADGSVVTLGAQSSVRIEDFEGESERRVIMQKGEALFVVAKHTDHPFTVLSGETLVRVLGTTFNVNKMTDAVTISLLEGKVNIVQEADDNLIPFFNNEETVTLLPAQQVSISGGKLQAVAEKNITDMATWVGGQLSYNGEPLSVVIAGLNRYSQAPIIIRDKRLNNSPVTAVFGADQVDTFLKGLPHLLPLTILKNPKGEYLIFSAKPRVAA